MKEFNFSKLKIHDSVVTIGFEFTMESGIVIDETISKIEKMNSVQSNTGCDFVTRGFSCSSKSFAEIQDPTFSCLFFNLSGGYKLSGYCYCLPENVSIVKANIEQKIRAFLTREIVLTEKAIEKIKTFL